MQILEVPSKDIKLFVKQLFLYIKRFTDNYVNEKLQLWQNLI